MTLDNKVINVATKGQFIVTTHRNHIDDFYVEEFGRKVNLAYEAKISHFPGVGKRPRRKDVIVYINQCNDLNLSIGEFHVGVCCLVRYYKNDLVDFIVKTLNDDAKYSTIAKRNGGLIYPNEVHVLTIATDFAPVGLKESLDKILLPL